MLYYLYWGCTVYYYKQKEIRTCTNKNVTNSLNNHVTRDVEQIFEFFFFRL